MLQEYQNDYRPQKNKLKKGLIAGACICTIAAALGTGWYFFKPSDSIIDKEATAYVCRPKGGASNSSLALYLDSDGETISRAVFKDGVDEEFISKELEKSGATDDSLRPEYLKHLNEYGQMYYAFTSGNEGLDWLKTNISFNNDLYEVLLEIDADIKKSGLDTSSEEFVTYLANMGLDAFRDEKAGKYLLTDESLKEFMEINEAECQPLKE